MEVYDASQDPKNIRTLHPKESKENQYSILEKLLEEATNNATQFKTIHERLEMILQDLREEQKIELTRSQPDGSNKHIICLVILPFKNGPNALHFDYDSVLLPALQNVFEQHPYYWQVAYSNDKVHDDTFDINTEMWMKQAQTYIVDVTDRDPDVMVKFGNIESQAKRRKQPIFILEREGAPQLPSKSGITSISYRDLSGPHAIDDITKDLAFAFAGKPKVKEILRTSHYHYMSYLLLMREEFSMSKETAIALSSNYQTMESFQSAPLDDICKTILGLSRQIARGYQEAVRALLCKL